MNVNREIPAIRFAVGYQLTEPGDEPFVRLVEEYRDHIAEVYFPWLDAPSGRAPLATRRGTVDWSAQRRVEDDLRALKVMGVKLDLLFNASCYGRQGVSQHLANEVCSIVEHTVEVAGLDIVTTTSPFVAHVVRENFPQVEVRASVNMRIGTVQGMEYVAHLFDSFHLQREYNRDLGRIRQMKGWTDGHDKKLILLANSGCMRFCSGQTFHDNLVAHEAEVDEMQNLPGYTPHLCWNYYRDRRHWPSILANTWVRPEDLRHYEPYFSVMKLATRMHAHPRVVVQAYVERAYGGNLLDLFEPGLGPALAPHILDNTRFPADWFSKSATGAGASADDPYFSQVLEKVLVRADGA